MICVMIAGCAQTMQEEPSQLLLYYCVASTKTTGSALGTESVQLDEMTVDALINRLLEGPEDTSSFSSTFPSGTGVKHWSVEDGILTLDLSESFGRLTGYSLIRAEYCIVLTMTQLDEVSAVCITVEDQPLYGGASGALTANDVLLQGETEDPVEFTVQLYFPLQDGSGLGVENATMQVSELTLKALATADLQRLATGTTQSYMQAFLQNAGLLEIDAIRNGICAVNIDAQTMICLAGDDNEVDLLSLYALVNSLVELDGIDAVSFLMEGEEIDGWLETYTGLYDFSS